MKYPPHLAADINLGSWDFSVGIGACVGAVFRQNSPESDYRRSFLKIMLQNEKLFTSATLVIAGYSLNRLLYWRIVFCYPARRFVLWGHPLWILV